MARNKDFFINSAPKREKSFFVKEVANANGTTSSKATPQLPTTLAQKSITGMANTAPSVKVQTNISTPTLPTSITKYTDIYNNVKTENAKQKAQLEAQIKESGLNFSDDEKKKLQTGNYKINVNYNPNERFSQKIIYAGDLLTSKDAHPTLGQKISNVAQKTGNTAMDLVGKGAIGVTQGLEGMVDFGVTSVGNSLSNLTSGGGLLPNKVSEGIRGKTEDFVKYGLTNNLNNTLEQVNKEKGGIYRPSILGVGVRDIAQEGARMLTTAYIGGLPAMMVSAAGGSTEEALNEGEKLSNAYNYGVISGAIEGATERMFDTFNLIGGGVFDKILPKSVIGKFITGGIGEGVEEGVSGALNPFIKMLTYEGEVENPFGSWDNFKVYLQDLGQQMLAGAVTGWVMQGAADVSSSSIRSQFRSEVSNAVNKLPVNSNIKTQIADSILGGANKLTNEQIDNGMKAYKSYVNEYMVKNAPSTISKENVTGFPKASVQNAGQNVSVKQTNEITPREIKTVENVNVEATEPKNIKMELESEINSNKYLTDEEKSNLISALGEKDVTNETAIAVREILGNVNKNFETAIEENKYKKYLKDERELDRDIVDRAKNSVTANKSGRRTKEQWLSVAKNLGQQIYNMTDAEVERYAYKTWIENKPNTKDNLNRQGKGYIKFTVDEWVNSVYDSTKQARDRVNPNLQTQKAQETFRSAKIAGMTDVDMNKAIELNKLLQSGAKLEFYDANRLPQNVSADKAKSANGFYQDGTIWINKNSGNAVEQILGHELTHHLESTNSFTELTNTILDSNVFYDFLAKKGYSNIAEYKEKLRGMEYSDNQLDSEIVARFVEEEMFTDQNTINRLAKQNSSIVEKIRNWINNLIVSVKGTTQEKELRKIENMYRKALEQARSRQANITNQVTYSQNILDDGTMYIKTNDNNFRKADGTKMTPREAYNSLVGITLQFPDGQTAQIVKNLPSKDMYNELYRRNPTYRNVKDIKGVNNTINDNIVELLENSELTNTSLDFNNKHAAQGITNFDTRKVTFFDGEIAYDITFSIAELEDGSKVAYAKKFLEPNEDILTKIKKAETSSKSPVNPPSNNSINPNESPVNTEYSQNNKNDTQYSMNPVEIAKNPPNIETGLDALKKAKKVKEGDSQSSFSGNISNQSIFDEKFTKVALDDKNITSYESITNKETLQQANDAINEQGQKWVDRFLEKSNGEMKATDIAGGFILMNRYQQVGDYESMIRVAEKLRKAGTQQGQTIQMFSVLGRMTPEGMTYYAQTELSKAYDEILKNKTQAWADQHADEFKLNDRDIDFIQRRVNQASKLPEGRDKYILLAEIAERIQSKIPPQPGEGLKALARNSMLLNPKTMIRNILGNVVIVPNHIISDYIGTGIDKAISKKTGIRTTGGFDLKALGGAKKGLYESFDDFRRKISTREMSGDRFEIGKGGQSFNENHTGKFATTRNAINKALNGLDRVTGFLLEAGDRPFYETWFINSLNNQMRLNNVTSPTAEMIEIATDEALQRTWQDNNSYTKVVSSVRNGLNKLNVNGYGLGDMVMPFVKTPANLTKAVVDFSPLGAINAALKTSQLKKDLTKGVATAKQQREIVKAWSQVITGTLGMAIMTAMANAGVLSGGSDDDKDVRAFEQNILGIKTYSIKIGDTSYTYDWAQPLGTSAAMVTDTVKSLKNITDTEGKVGAVLKGAQSGASVLLEQSFVSGIRNLFEEDNLINAIIETGMNEGAKFTPQFLGQIAQVQDDTARTSYVYNDIPKTAINKVKAKIPGLRQTLEPSVDVLGREVKTNNRVDNVMLNPANTAFARTTKGAEEMYRVYQSTGDKASIAQVAPYYFNVGDKKVVLTPKQRTQYQKTIGSIASNGVENLLNNEAYNKLPDTDKAEVLKELYSYGNAIAKEEASRAYLLPKSMSKIKNSGMEPEEYILMKYISGLEGLKKDEMLSSLTSAGYTKKEAEKFLADYKGYQFTTNGRSMLPTLSSKRSKLPTLKK